MSDLNRNIKAVIGSVAGALGLYRRHFASRMFVVAFHRVTDELPEDGLTCSSSKFSEFCAFFKRHFRVVPFKDQVQACHEGHGMGGTLSITFDDGYADNIRVAAPILRRHGLPATFFITTGFIGSDLIPFWDAGLPVQPGWMSWDDVRELAAMGFDIGAHTDTHIDMGKEDEAVIRAELAICKSKLESEIRRPVGLFVYPFGGPGQIRPRSLELVKEAGFVSCASCFGGTNPACADPFSLKRIGIAEWFAQPHQLGAELLLGKA